tara:strand:- start:2125 stop:3429 length:1305 start_codon:yes stop_codon:yes gene_type:complete
LYKYFDQQKFEWEDKKHTLDQLKFLINKFLSEKSKADNLYNEHGNKAIKLHSSTLNTDSIYSCLHSMLEGNITLGEGNQLYEKNISDFFKVNNAITVNSGSSANLLAIFGLVEVGILNKGDKVIVPSLSWSTTVFPLAQAGLIPVFCDQSEIDFNINLDQVEEQAKKDDVKALMLIHTYGLSANMDRVLDICQKNNITLIEDTCESMGASWNSRFSGSFGVVSTFSTYFSHHICTLEGGIVLTSDNELDKIYRSMRSHGWARHFPENSEIFTKYKDHDPSFLFPNTGFNLRISEPQAKIGIEQIKLLPSILEKRIISGNEYIDRIQSIPEIKSYFIDSKARCVFFGLPILLPDNFDYKRTLEFRKKLRVEGIETRPFLCGDFTNQPALKKINFEKPYKCNVANTLHQRSIALPCHQDITVSEVKRVVNTIKKFI